MLVFFCILWVLLAASDAGITIHILRKHGIDKELNGAIRKLCAWWGIPKGVIVGIFIPTLAIAGLGWMFHLLIPMVILCWLRCVLIGLQVSGLIHADR